MRFGLVLPIQARGSDLSRLWHELCAETAAAEQAGFDAVFLTEFHQARGGALVSPLLLGAALLQATRRIRFGSAVLAAPLHHPVRVAEDVLMLDWLSGGRVILGLGIGHLPADFAAFGVPHAQRARMFEEFLDVLDACLGGEPFEYRGRYYTLRAAITPLPRTLPRPPVWVGAHGPAGIARAARRADCWLSDPQRDVPTLARLARHYRLQCEAAGRVPRVALFREGWIGDSRRACERDWGPHVLAVHRLYYNVGTYRPEYEPWVERVRAREQFTFELVARDRFLYGSGQDIVEDLRHWRSLTGAEYLAVRMRHPGGPGHAAVVEAIARFGAEVIAPMNEPPVRGAQALE